MSEPASIVLVVDDCTAVMLSDGTRWLELAEDDVSPLCDADDS